jgi:hypothetical protein
MTEMIYDPPQPSDRGRDTIDHNHASTKQRRRNSILNDIDWVQSLSDKFKPSPSSPALIAAQKSKEENWNELERLKISVQRIEEEKKNERTSKEEREKEDLRKKVMEMTVWRAEQEQEDVRRKEEKNRAEWMCQIHGLKG